jgi:hypothetical protein
MKVVGYSMCVFCDGIVRVEYTCRDVDEFLRATLLGEIEIPIKVFCSDECSRASALRLDEQVNTCAA